MRILFVLAGLILCTNCANAENTQHEYGELKLIPPTGFTVITSKMGALNEYFLRLKIPEEKLLGYFISDSDAKRVIDGHELPELTKWFGVSSLSGALGNRRFARSEFLGFKEYTKRNFKELFDSVQSRIQSHLVGLTGELSKEQKIDYALKIEDMFMLEQPFYEDKNIIVFSGYSKTRWQTGNDAAETKTISSSLAFADISGELLIFKSYGPRNKLAWTQTALTKWVKIIVKENTL